MGFTVLDCCMLNMLQFDGVEETSDEERKIYQQLIDAISARQLVKTTVARQLTYLMLNAATSYSETQRFEH